ncbi:hypothetical protein B4U80_13151 [Leptotrombidium deliense]|uniref:SHC SH2 domain-containing protein n=1 Tax=Leptotrombidium deliense TaxID=299467 RepID=A0A443SBK0_9ACAR|nr:hypothetical protein B4U80_13151 [Leptotrombidium deliense]
MNESFVAKNNYPSIYKIHFEKPTELLTTFNEIILKDVTISGVQRELVKYVTTVIEPLGWRAIWRCSNDSYGLNFTADFETEVIDVSRNSLEATIIVKKLLSPELSNVSGEDSTALENLLTNKSVVTVPLIELYVINEDDDNCEFLQTAMTIEYIRFFWKCIWRPWDDSPITQLVTTSFMEACFIPRFNLYCDIQDKIVVKSTVNKINRLLDEAWKVRKKLDTIVKNYAHEENIVEKEDLDENVMYESLKLRYKLEEMERAMKLLEDPFSRIIASSVIANLMSNTERSGRVNYCTTHFLSHLYDYSSVKEVTSFIEKNEINDHKIMFHSSLNAAIASSVSGDKIVIFPGLYMCDSLPWLDFDITIEGMTTHCDEVVLQSSEDVGDVFLHCNAKEIEMSNITWRTSATTRCILMVHNGLVRLNNCVFGGTDQSQKAFITLSNARVALDKCNISNNEIVCSGGDVLLNDHFLHSNDKNVSSEIE